MGGIANLITPATPANVASAEAAILAAVAAIPASAPPAVTSIVNATSSGAVAVNAVSTTHMLNANAKAVLSGALTANTLATVLNITGGGGYLDILGAASVDATARTHRIVITVDGGAPAVYDAVSSSVAAANVGILAVGGLVVNAGTTVGILRDPMRFNSSLLVQYASSLTETDKTNIYYACRLG